MRSEWPGFRNSSAGAAVIRFVLVPFVLFVILVVWALVQNDMYPKEALILGGVWLLLFAGVFLLPGVGVYCIVPMVLIDIWLLVKLVGNPSVT